MNHDAFDSALTFADLKGKVVVVTGAARGIGRAVATYFACNRARVVAVDISAEVLCGPVEADQWAGFQADVSDPDSVARMIDFCLSEAGPPRLLMNVAGISTPSPVLEMTLENWQKNLDVNLTSVFLCTRAVLPHMIEAGGGSIVSFSSAIARTGGETSAHYCAAKAGIEGFSRALAREVGSYGIRVNVIAPGLIETDMLGIMPEKQKQKLIRRLPLQRVGHPDDLAGLAGLLASDAGAYITGQTIHVNGGLFMS